MVTVYSIVVGEGERVISRGAGGEKGYIWFVLFGWCMFEGFCVREGGCCENWLFRLQVDRRVHPLTLGRLWVSLHLP